MATLLRTLQELEGRRVAMRFDDGQEVVGLLLSATKDIDGSQHLIYDVVEWTNQSETRNSDTGLCRYADAKTLVSIEPVGEALAGAT